MLFTRGKYCLRGIRLLVLLFALQMIFTHTSVLDVYADENISLNSKSAILISAADGNVLFEKDAHQRMYPASTTKIMTAIVALEKGKLDRMVPVTQSAMANFNPDGSNMSLLVGEELPMERLLQGLMVASANDAASVIAEFIAGSEQAFVGIMNARAKELGAMDTNFVNPHGLHDDEHYTTAYDLAVISRYAMTIPKFRELANIAHINIPPTNLVENKRYFMTTNSLISRLKEYTYFYNRAKGIKTGHTSKAGYCLASYAENNDFSLIAVTLGAEMKNGTTYSFVDSKNLLEHGFNNFKQVTIAKEGGIIGETRVHEAQGSDYAILTAQRALRTVIPKEAEVSTLEKKIVINGGKKLFAPVKKGRIIGEAIYYYEGRELGRIELSSDRDIKRNPVGFIYTFFEFAWGFSPFRIVVAVLAIAVFLYVVIVIAAIRVQKKNSARRRASRSYRRRR